MGKKEFNDLLVYLKNHPSEVKRMTEILHIVEHASAEQRDCKQQDDEWMSARQMAKEVGMSAKWVKERISMLPQGEAAQQKNGRRQWLVKSTSRRYFEKMKLL